MNATLKTTVLGLVCLLFAALPAAADDAANMKKLMGENFQNALKILTELIRADYTTVPKDVDVIRQHAELLMKTPPVTLKTTEEKELFYTYATNLKSNANHLIVVTQELNRRDKEQSKPGELKVDYLRVVAAEHYGSIITTCVLCHNQFRRHMVK